MRLTALSLLLPVIAAVHVHLPRDSISSSATLPPATSTFDSEFPNVTPSPDTYPECADDCYKQAQGQTTDCEDGDTACLCYQPEVQGFIASCLEASCSTKDLETAAQYGIDLCKAVISGNSTSSAATDIQTSLSSASQANATDVITSSNSSAIETTSVTSSAEPSAQTTELVAVTESTSSTTPTDLAVAVTETATAPTTLSTPATVALSGVSTASVARTTAPSTSTTASRISAEQSSTGAAVPMARAGMVGVIIAAGSVVLAL